MKKQTLGMMISSLRKGKGMTQLELAEKMGVTDKAVSKWERDLSFPDINAIPISNFRVDTDSDNKKMQHILKKNGFDYCGTIWFDNSEKIAFDKKF